MVKNLTYVFDPYRFDNPVQIPNQGVWMVDPVIDRQPKTFKRQSTIKVIYGKKQSEYHSKRRKRKKVGGVIEGIGEIGEEIGEIVEIEEIEEDSVVDCCCCLCGIFMETIASSDQ